MIAARVAAQNALQGHFLPQRGGLFGSFPRFAVRVAAQNTLQGRFSLQRGGTVAGWRG